MSGIVATLGRADEALLDRLNLALLHRGPNDTGARLDNELNVGIAQRRLMTGRAPGGEMPMSTPDGALWIVLDGEVTNGAALRRKLQAAGKSFVSETSDAEVLLHLYAEKGDAMVPEISGAFAFIIIDRPNRRVFGARDRFGIRPLYYARAGATVTLASELKALLLVPGFEPRVRRQAAYHFLTLGWTPGGETMLEGIERVPPAHSFAWDVEKCDLSFRRYWQPRLEAREGISDDEAVEIFREAFGAAVSRWGGESAPGACALSGGLASSMALTSFAKKTGKTPDAITLRVGDMVRHPAARVASLFSARHEEDVMAASEFARDLVSIAWQLDEPNGGAVETWYAFERMSRSTRSGFTGAGADVAFGCGGRWASLERWPLNSWSRRWKKGEGPGLTGLFSGGESPVRAGYLRKNFPLTDDEKRRSAVLDPRRLVDTASIFDDLFRSAPSDDPLDAATWVEMNTMLPAQTLASLDRFSMAHGLSLRHPFLDHDFAQSMFSIPSNIRSTAREPRRLLQLAAKHVLPDDVVERPLSPSPMPIAAWLRTELRPAAETLLNPERLRRQGILNPDFYASMLASHLKGADHSQALWYGLQFQLWHLIFIEQRCRSRPAFSISDLAGVAV